MATEKEWQNGTSAQTATNFNLFVFLKTWTYFSEILDLCVLEIGLITKDTGNLCFYFADIKNELFCGSKTAM